MRPTGGLFSPLLLALLAVPALNEGKLADAWKGKAFHAACQPGAPEAQTAYLAGYVTGSADASMGKSLCPRKPVTTPQLVAAFCKYLGAHPKNHNRPGGLLLGLAFSGTWPCR